MAETGFESPVERRSFFSRGLAACAAIAGIGGLAAQAQSLPQWKPIRHAEDDWLNLPGKHRVVFDSATPDGFGLGLLFCGNYYVVHQDAYNLKNNELAAVLVARHHATPFAFNDVIWGKYGTILGQLANFIDPKTKQAPASNLYNAADYGALNNRGTTIDSLTKRGMRIAVCGMATRQLSDAMAASVGSNGGRVYAEVVANLVPNARLVPSGVIAVTRAQERGYSIIST